MQEIRVLPGDFTIVGAHSPQGQTFSARVYAPLAEALASPNLFLNAGGGVQVLDTIRLSRTDKGSLKHDKGNRAYETVELMVVGFEGRRPIVDQLGPIKVLSPSAPALLAKLGNSGDDPRFPTAHVMAAAPSEAKLYNSADDDLRDILTITERKTGQGRGKPALISYEVTDGLNNIIDSFKDKSSAEQFINTYRKPAE